MCVYVCVLTSCLVFTVVDFLSDGAQSNGLLDDVVVVGDLSSGGHRQVSQCPGECDVCVQVCMCTCVLETSFMKGQLSSCLTSSTVSCSQADISWTP